MAKKDDWRSTKIWKCECCDSEFITLQVYNFSEEGEPDLFAYISLAAMYASPDGFCDRIKAAWDILRKHPVCRAEVLLSADTAREVAGELLKAAKLLDGEDWHLIKIERPCLPFPSDPLE